MTRKTLVTQWSGGDDMKVAAWQRDTGETAHEDTKRRRGCGMRATAIERERERWSSTEEERGIKK